MLRLRYQRAGTKGEQPEFTTARLLLDMEGASLSPEQLQALGIDDQGASFVASYDIALLDTVSRQVDLRLEGEGLVRWLDHAQGEGADFDVELLPLLLKLGADLRSLRCAEGKLTVGES